jgi:hypothetical protein
MADTTLVRVCVVMRCECVSNVVARRFETLVCFSLRTLGLSFVFFASVCSSVWDLSAVDVTFAFAPAGHGELHRPQRVGCRVA